MIAFKAVPYTPQLGQLSQFTSGITANLARQIVGEAEPALRRIIRVERNRFAEAVIEGIPFAALAAIGYTATRYLVPDAAHTAKAVGYIASAASMAISAWWILRRLTETAEEPGPVTAPGAPPPQIVVQTAQAIVKEAEPRVRQIVSEERERLTAALQAGVPFLTGAIAAFLATMFLVDDKNRSLKTLGYSASALLVGAGTWLGLEQTKEAAA